MSVTAADPARSKVKQIFEFLKALDEHRNPVKRQVSDYSETIRLAGLPAHRSVEFIYPSDEAATGAEPGGTKDFVLKVRRPALSKPPEPPAQHREWVVDGWQDPFKKVQFLDELSRSGMFAEPEGFDTDPERVGELAAWQVSRDRWATAERPAREAMALFERLYALHGRFAREGDELELVLGDGILNWRVPTGGIHHPVLFQGVELHFEPRVPEFTLVETDSPVELYSGMLRGVEGLPADLLPRLRSEMAELSPLQGRAVSAYLKGLVASLAAGGQFLDSPPERGETDVPRVWREPWLLVRKRAAGFAAAIDAVLAQLESLAPVPSPLRRIAGCADEPAPEPPPNPVSGSTEEPDDVLFGKPANPEQIEVADRLAQHSSVVVQGPPGTGKTHTIANLLGHLLAQGKSVLVTSHTEKALSVLRSHLVDELQPLCISVLGSDTESRKQLENAVNAIVERLSSGNLQRLQRTAENLRKRRRELIDHIRGVRSRIIRARQAEYESVIAGDQALTPSEAARRVAAGRAECEWLPGPLEPGAPLPLSNSEVSTLYASNGTLSVHDEMQLERGLPPIEPLPMPALVRDLANESEVISGRDRALRSDLWTRAADPDEVPALQRLVAEIDQLVAGIDALEPWQRHLVEIGLSGSEPKKAHWIRLLEEIGRLDSESDSCREIVYRLQPELARHMAPEQQVAVCDAIVDHLRHHPKVGVIARLRHADWRPVLEEARVRGREPSSLEDFEALRSVAALQIARTQLLRRWGTQAAAIGLPSAESLGPQPEPKLGQLGTGIAQALRWPEGRLAGVRKALKEAGFDLAGFEAGTPSVLSGTPLLDRLAKDLVARLRPIVEARLAAASVGGSRPRESGPRGSP